MYIIIRVLDIKLPLNIFNLKKIYIYSNIEIKKMSKHINTRFVNLQKYVAVFNFEDICYSTYLHVIRDAEIFFLSETCL